MIERSQHAPLLAIAEESFDALRERYPELADVPLRAHVNGGAASAGVSPLTDDLLLGGERTRFSALSNRLYEPALVPTAT